jgi:hypothetical protein
MKKTFYIIASLILTKFYALAQSGYDDPMDEEERASFERYAHLGLSSDEKISIGVGIALFVIANLTSESFPKLKTPLLVLGGFCCIPLFLVILAVAQKVISYGITLALIIGVLYFIFRPKNKYNR